MERKPNRRSRGQSLVEAALALPILIMLMLGLLDFGRAYYALVTLRDAAEEGAMYASMNQNPDEIGERVRDAESTSLIPLDDTDKVKIGVSSGPYTVGDAITVTVTYSMPLYTPFASNLVSGGSLALRGQAVQVIAHAD